MKIFQIKVVFFKIIWTNLLALEKLAPMLYFLLNNNKDFNLLTIQTKTKVVKVKKQVMILKTNKIFQKLLIKEEYQSFILK